MGILSIIFNPTPQAELLKVNGMNIQEDIEPLLSDIDNTYREFIVPKHNQILNEINNNISHIVSQVDQPNRMDDFDSFVNSTTNRLAADISVLEAITKEMVDFYGYILHPISSVEFLFEQTSMRANVFSDMIDHVIYSKEPDITKIISKSKLSPYISDILKTEAVLHFIYNHNNDLENTHNLSDVIRFFRKLHKHSASRFSYHSNHLFSNGLSSCKLVGFSVLNKLKNKRILDQIEKEQVFTAIKGITENVKILIEYILFINSAILDLIRSKMIGHLRISKHGVVRINKVPFQFRDKDLFDFIYSLANYLEENNMNTPLKLYKYF